ncbi:hypothetical protein GCM10023175_62060 [Pseudonocardia xishanensis]|uniref:Uncharacterized protein n=2 Tax=Pseudonocardia xishanensis TaxID=630995 RepID=A0ABP8S1U0_9PSEU
MDGRPLGRGIAVGAPVGGAGRPPASARHPAPAWLPGVAATTAAVLGAVAAARTTGRPEEERDHE